jgi:hypothetical protein
VGNAQEEKSGDLQGFFGQERLIGANGLEPKTGFLEKPLICRGFVRKSKRMYVSMRTNVCSLCL